jgi:hypothetical protein
MNPELIKLAQAAGAPQEVMDQLWFHVFCIKFADQLLTMAENEISQ